MTDSQLHKILSEIGEEIVPAGTDLWQKIQHRIKIEKRFPSHGDNAISRLQRNIKNYQYAFAFTSLTLLLVIFLSFTNPGRAFAQSILRFFQQVSTDMLPAPGTLPADRAETEKEDQTPRKLSGIIDLGDLCLKQTLACSTDEIRKLIDLPFKDISILPNGFVFERLIGSPENFSSIYVESKQNALLILKQKMITGETISPIQKVGSSALVEQVTIGELTGEYVRGGFIYADDESWIQWDNTRVTQNLVWVEKGVLYHLSYNGRTLTKESLIELAANLSDNVNHERHDARAADAEAYPDPTFKLSIAEAEELLGYSLYVPESLPEDLSLIGVSVEPISSMATIKYTSASGNGLLLQQWEVKAFEENPLPPLIDW